MTRHLFHVTITRAASSDLVHERTFRTEVDAVEWASAFVRDRFNARVGRYSYDASYAPPIIRASQQASATEEKPK